MSARVVLGYVRVSTIEQERGFGPDVQRAAIERYCEEKDLGSPTIHHESKSGEDLIKRNELHLVLALAESASEEGMEAHVVFYSLDRLTRALVDQEAIVTRCHKMGVRLHSTDPSERDTLDPAFADDPMRVAIRQFFGIIHQLERSIISRRLKGGLRRKGSVGGFCGGRPPFGYRVEQRDLVVDDETAPAVRRVFQLRSAGLELAGIAAVLGREFPQCRHWRKQQVRRVLERRELYVRGAYRPRDAEETTVRPELIIVDGREDAPPQPTAEVDLDTLPDPMSLAGVALVLGASEERLRELISSKGLMVRWRGTKALVPRRTAKRMCDLLKDLEEEQPIRQKSFDF